MMVKYMESLLVIAHLCGESLQVNTFIILPLDYPHDDIEYYSKYVW